MCQLGQPVEINQIMHVIVNQGPDAYLDLNIIIKCQYMPRRREFSIRHIIQISLRLFITIEDMLILLQSCSLLSCN